MMADNEKVTSWKMDSKLFLGGVAEKLVGVVPKPLAARKRALRGG